jgi:hypothetical protein
MFFVQVPNQPFTANQLKSDLQALINPQISTFFGFAVTMAVIMRIFR